MNSVPLVGIFYLSGRDLDMVDLIVLGMNLVVDYLWQMISVIG